MACSREGCSEVGTRADLDLYADHLYLFAGELNLSVNNLSGIYIFKFPREFEYDIGDCHSD